MNKLLSFFKEQYKYVIFFIVFFILNMFFFYRDFFYSRSLKVLIIFFLILSIAAFYFSYKLSLNKKKIEKQFVIWASIIGILYTFIMPIGFAPDEANHFRRAYEISLGHLVSDKSKDGVGGRKLPSAINDTFSFKITTSKYSKNYNLPKNVGTKAPTFFFIIQYFFYFV